MPTLRLGFLDAKRCASLFPGKVTKLRFVDSYTDKAGQYSLGRDSKTSDYYLSIPVSNRLVDYEEYYRLSRDLFGGFLQDRSKALGFADRCRARECDDLLILQPGADRGEPR